MQCKGTLGQASDGATVPSYPGNFAPTSFPTVRPARSSHRVLAMQTAPRFRLRGCLPSPTSDLYSAAPIWNHATAANCFLT